MLGFIDYELLMSYSPQSEYPNNATGDFHARSHGLDMGSSAISSELVEPRRIELLTSCVQDRCSPS